MELWNPLNWIASVPVLSIVVAVGGGALLFVGGRHFLNWLAARVPALRSLRENEGPGRFLRFGLMGLAFVWLIVIGYYIPGRSTAGFVERPREVWLLDQALCVTDAKNLSAGRMGRVIVYMRVSCLDRATGRPLFRRNAGSVLRFEAAPGGFYVLRVPVFPRSLWVPAELYFLDPGDDSLTLLGDAAELRDQAGLSGEIYSIDLDGDAVDLITLDKRRGRVSLPLLLARVGVQAPAARPVRLNSEARGANFQYDRLTINQESTSMRPRGPYRLTITAPGVKGEFTEETLTLRDLFSPANSDDLVRYLHLDGTELLLLSDGYAASIDPRTLTVRWNTRL